MEITGKIIEVLEEKSGQSSKGGWRKQEYILETQDQYPKKVCFMVWGDKIDDFGVQLNQEVEVSIDIESREFNGRWYTDVKAWKVAQKGSGASGASAAPAPPSGNQAPLPDEEPLGLDENSVDDLPF